MMTLPNFLSFLRFPLAFLFLQENMVCRVFAIFLAMVTDWLDGFLARRYKQTSITGRVLDPITDKFFVCFILIIFVKEGQVKLWEALTFLARDASIFIFGLYLFLKNRLKNYGFQPFWSGKIFTTIQLFLLLSMTFKIVIPYYFFLFLLFLGFISLLELFTKNREASIF